MSRSIWVPRMLTEAQQLHQFDATMEALGELEMAMLRIIAHQLAEYAESPENGSYGLTEGLSAALRYHRDKIAQQAHDDMAEGFRRNAETDLRDAHATAEAAEWARTEAGRIAQRAMADTRMTVEQMLTRMQQAARHGYYDAAREAARVAPRTGYREALRMAVENLGRNGITEYSYRRRNGQVVKVPVDVAVRRELGRSGKARQTAQSLDIADRTGVDLVDVSFCADARQSHAVWQGQRYQLRGSDKYPNFYAACLVGDLVEGYGGYNCHHTLRLVHDEQDPFGFRDPLEGTGYTNEQVRDLTTKQRQLENAIRKAKRASETLQAAGMDARDAKKAVRLYQAQMRELISAHPRVLHRDRWREQI